MKRIFIGIPVSQTVCESIRKILQPLSKFEERFFWIPEENWHITLSFIGDVEDDKVSKIQTTFSEFVAKQNYFNIYFDGVDFFPSEKNAKKIILTMVKNRNLMELQYGLRTALREFLPASEQDRKFRPHVSIINLKRTVIQPEFRDRVQEFEFKKRFEVDTLACIESFIEGKPPVKYKVLSEVKMIVDDKFQPEDPEES